MISTSQNWIRALGNSTTLDRPRLVPEAFVQLIYKQTDDGAQLSATATSSDAVSWAYTGSIINLVLDTSNNNGTLEMGSWFLDGAHTLVAPHPQQTHGYVSNLLSDTTTRTFTSNPTVTITFSSVRTKLIPGITITWSSDLAEYATDFTVTSYNDSLLLDTITITNNTSVVTTVPINLQNYNKIIISVSKWCMPGKRARIDKVMIGTQITLNKSSLISFEQSMSTDLMSFTLPDYYINFEIDNVDERWNPDNPSGIYTYLTERQRIDVKFGYTIDNAIEWHDAGTYYTSEWTTPQNGISASFTARSLVEFMNGQFDMSQVTITVGGEEVQYSFGDSITLAELAQQAFEQSNLPTEPDGTTKWYIDEALESISVVIPYSGEGADRKFDFNYTCAEVIQFCANASATIIAIATNGDVVITSVVPDLTDYTIDRFTSYTNAEYELSKSLKEVVINDTYTTAYSDSGETQTMSNPLIQSQSQANDVGAWIANILGKRKTLTGEYRSDPRLETADVIKSINKYATNTVWVTDVKYTYSGAFKGTYKGRVLASISNESLEGEHYVGITDGIGETYMGEDNEIAEEAVEWV